ncbi:MAG: hypothetical protein OFPI_14660 [Osedax symbiont Rs2]|nr:MAG: hypothetical protein OFPI_14660 [Osedax symbiont Rs2]
MALAKSIVCLMQMSIVEDFVAADVSEKLWRCHQDTENLILLGRYDRTLEQR